MKAYFIPNPTVLGCLIKKFVESMVAKIFCASVESDREALHAQFHLTDKDAASSF